MNIKVNLWLTFMVSLAALVAMAGCGAPAPDAVTTQASTTPETAATQPAAEARILRVMAHDSFAISEEVLAQFESQNNARVQFIKSGDTGTALNKAILSREEPFGGCILRGRQHFPEPGAGGRHFRSLRLAAAGHHPGRIPAGPRPPRSAGRLWRCVPELRSGYFEQKGLAPPESLYDLLKPEYKGLLVVQNPATSSPGLAFLLATIGVYGPVGYLDYWDRLVANDVLVVNDWESAYYTEFSGSSGKGPRPTGGLVQLQPCF